MTEEEIEDIFRKIYSGFDPSPAFDFLSMISDDIEEKGEIELAETMRWCAKIKIRPVAAVHVNPGKFMWQVEERINMLDGVNRKDLVPSVICSRSVDIGLEELRTKTSNISFALENSPHLLVTFDRLLDCFRFLIPLWRRLN